jgi:predicted RNA-binding Zn-ribbon protein involved in translation (DUF1610 family)
MKKPMCPKCNEREIESSETKRELTLKCKCGFEERWDIAMFKERDSK